MTTKAKCSVEGCTRDARAKGMCHLHYKRERSHGDTAAPSRTKLSNAHVAAIRAYKPRRGLLLELAHKFDVSESTISAIRLGKRRAKK